jgi:hypothetical protein
VSLRDGAAAIRKPREAPGDLHRAWR